MALRMDPLDRCLDDVAPLVDPARIAAGIRELAQIERPTDWDSFQSSARYLRDRFLAIGADAEFLRFPADGRTRFGCFAQAGFFVALVNRKANHLMI